jgi:hypothetical protein
MRKLARQLGYDASNLTTIATGSLGARSNARPTPPTA